MMSGADMSALRAALDAARGVFGAYDRTPVPALWEAAEAVLHGVVARPELRGQALVSEARRVGALTLADANALVALSSLADRTTESAATEGERILVREAWMALQHAVPDDDVPAAGTVSSYAPPGSPWAPPSAPSRADGAPRETPRSVPRDDAASRATNARSTSPDHLPLADEVAVVAKRRTVPAWAILAVLVVLIVGAGGAWWWLNGRHARAYGAAVAAYQRGSRETARAGFVALAQETPDDARPLIYLGRMARDDKDLALSRRFLTNAVRLDPASGLAARELASTMLADGQPEIARRFYVRAIELDPTDRVSQGFLGCALMRLGRPEEALRWGQRAGAGDWQSCLVPPAPMVPPTGAPPRPR